MRYESQKTEKGNVGVSYESQEAADLQAATMDADGCTGCTGCTGCQDCRYCTDCHDCTGCYVCHTCTNCQDCTGCRYCTDCHGCTDCHTCTDCRYCTDCTDCSYCINCTDTKGASRWDGEPAKGLLSLNGLSWSVSTDGKSIQIGCRHHSVEDWRNFNDRAIARMAVGAETFWNWYKDLVLGLAEVRRGMEEEA